jgi:aldose 1-epimerase
MTHPAMNPPSGAQYEIRHEDQHAVIVEVGGGIRSYRRGERDVLQPYGVGSMCDGAHGAPLIPWPNRLGDGQYRFDGTDYQVALTEPEKHNAIHGFLLWRSWSATDREADRITMSTQLYPLQGYPFQLAIQVSYALSDDGLTVVTTATNTGEHIAPYGAGQHPYLSPGNDVLDNCTLRLQAATRIVTDPARQLPTGTEPVAGTAYDFNEARPIGSLAIDYAFTDLTRDDSGRARVELTAPDGHTAITWVDENYPIIELFTADTLAPERQRRSLGTEPMTLPPNGFQTNTGVIRLAPGQTHSCRWGARLD